MIAKGKEPKKRILDAAVTLFAQKGYAAVGVREIAKTSGVNVAMISYYFDGKVGILKSIVEEFFDHIYEVYSVVDDESKSLEESRELLIRNLVNFIRGNTDLAMVTYNELPLDVPEIAELKAERISALLQRLSGFIRRFGLNPSDTLLIGTIGVSLVGMIFSHFRVRPVLKHILNVEFNDAYYERLIEIITTLFIEGVTGIVALKTSE